MEPVFSADLTSDFAAVFENGKFYRVFSYEEALFSFPFSKTEISSPLTNPTRIIFPMAIFDPPDGSTDPRPRCTGHCCRGFSLEHPLSVVRAEYEKWKVDPQSATLIPQVATIAEMLIPLGTFRGQELFTCKHLGKSGNCMAYETRPPMCRDFPGPKPCPYRNCASHGEQSALKKAVNWLRD